MTLLEKMSDSETSTPQTPDIAYVVKCVVVGDGVVGKTPLIERITTGKYPEEYVPTVFNCHEVNYEMVDGRLVNIQYWDSNGTDEYARLRTMLYPGADVFLLCFSVGDPKASFENVEAYWHPEIKSYNDEAPIILVGTKADTKEDLDEEEQNASLTRGQKLAERIGALSYLECSALSNTGVEEISLEVVRAGVFYSKGAAEFYNCNIL